jgi:hypothetical protein
MNLSAPQSVVTYLFISLIVLVYIKKAVRQIEKIIEPL